MKAEAPLLSLLDQREALRDGRIVGFVCKACGRQRVSPMVRCVDCGGEVETKEFATTGSVVSYTIQHVASESYMNEVPFAFVIVQLDDGPRISGWVEYVSRASDLPIGQKVRFEPSYKGGMRFEKA